MRTYNITVPLSAVTVHLVEDEVVPIPAGSAGALVNFYISTKPITDANGGYIGGKGNTSFSFSEGAFTTETHHKQDAELANGEFYLDYITGRGRGRKAANNTSMTVSYSVFVPFVPPVA